MKRTIAAIFMIAPLVLFNVTAVSLAQSEEEAQEEVKNSLPVSLRDQAVSSGDMSSFSVSSKRPKHSMEHLPASRPTGHL